MESEVLPVFDIPVTVEKEPVSNNNNVERGAWTDVKKQLREYDFATGTELTPEQQEQVRQFMLKNYKAFCPTPGSPSRHHMSNMQ